MILYILQALLAVRVASWCQSGFITTPETVLDLDYSPDMNYLIAGV